MSREGLVVCTARGKLKFQRSIEKNQRALENCNCPSAVRDNNFCENPVNFNNFDA